MRRMDADLERTFDRIDAMNAGPSRGARAVYWALGVPLALAGGLVLVLSGLFQIADLYSLNLLPAAFPLERFSGDLLAFAGVLVLVAGYVLIRRARGA
jgi:hypothetical protein